MGRGMQRQALVANKAELIAIHVKGLLTGRVLEFYRRMIGILWRILFEGAM